MSEQTADKQILIVEDEPFLALELECIIADLVSAEVMVCRCAADAMRAVETRAFDFALLDIEVLDGTTFDVADALAERGERFVFVSASNRRADAAQHGALDYIAKPYRVEDMRRVISRGLAAAA
jgi:DNA-binding NtrC family response regulator